MWRINSVRLKCKVWSVFLRCCTHGTVILLSKLQIGSVYLESVANVERLSMRMTALLPLLRHVPLFMKRVFTNQWAVHAR